MIAVWAAWAVWLIWRASRRYVGPADGPGWEPRPPLCEECGYIITGLHAGGVCPECNFPVAGSLPDLRQRTAFSLATTWRRRFSGFWRTFAEALIRPRFFRHLAVHDEHSIARCYAVWIAVLTGVILTAGVTITDMNHLRLSGRFPWVLQHPRVHPGGDRD